MRDNVCAAIQLTHKDEGAARVQLDSVDRRNLRHKMELCINPLSPQLHHTEGLINIVTGEVFCQPLINVDKALDLGKSQMETFEHSLPGSFYNPITKVINTIAAVRKHIRIGDTDVIDTEIIYAKAMGLQNSGREMDSAMLMSYELSPVPTSMFDQHGKMRIATAKSTLLNAMKEESPTRRFNEVDAIFLDGCAILWVISWPIGTATVQDYLDRFRAYVCDQLRRAPVYLVFDR